MSCTDCNRGSILDGNPSGTVQKVDGVDAYFISVPKSSTTQKFGVILLTDAFGLELVNSKLIADRIANELGCDVWVPDLFDGRATLSFLASLILKFISLSGQPMLKVDGLEDQLIPNRPGHWPLWDQLRFFACIIWNIRVFYRARPSVVTPRTAKVYLNPSSFGVYLT